MEDEKLIECVREVRLLYDLLYPLYSDSLWKTNQWQEIGKILKQGNFYYYSLLFIDNIIFRII